MKTGRKPSHGLRYTKEYTAWDHMKSRCSNPKYKNYHNYGGRGITVCERWLKSFENFYQDMGPAPTIKHSLDRLNNNGNYEPSNCKWSTCIEQQRNRRDNIKIVYNGCEKTLAEWAEIYKLKYRLFRDRINRGWDFGKAVSK